MFATNARTDAIEPQARPWPADAVGAADTADTDGDDALRTARGITLGAALGLVSIAALVLAVSWLF